MSLLDDTAIFVAIIQHGGFSHAARFLGLSNGLISRRMRQMEAKLGVTLLKRTTRQIQLTDEGKVFWEHAKRIQQELDAALCVIKASTDKPKGMIRISAPIYFGRNFLSPILVKFLQTFNDIQIDLVLSDRKVDPIKENYDLMIRGVGYLNPEFEDSSLKTKLLINKKIGVYCSKEYLLKFGEPLTPQDLLKHSILGFINKDTSAKSEVWKYLYKGQAKKIKLKTFYSSNDLDCRLHMCAGGLGIGKFSEVTAGSATWVQQLHPILTQYDWGNFNLYAVYPQQANLPKRTRMLLDFISAHIQ